MSQSSCLSESDIQALEEEAVPLSTKSATKYGMTRFWDWLEKRNVECDLHIISAAALNDILRRYFIIMCHSLLVNYDDIDV